MTTAAIIIISTLLLLSRSSSGLKQVVVEVDESSFTNVVDDIFHGVAMDSSVFRVTGLRPDINLKSPRLANLLKAISPCYFRVGGTAANWMFFDLPTKPLKALNLRKATILTKDQFDEIVELTLSTGNRLLFDLNAELRYGTDWNPSDAIRLMEHCKAKGYGGNIDLELGNEPNHNSPSELTPAQVAEDVKVFHELVRQYPLFKHSSLVGPDVGWDGVNFFTDVANVSGQFLRAYTIHPYYFNGKTATVADYMDSSNFIKLGKLFHKVRASLKGVNNSDKPWWLGETSTGYNSGTRDVADRYVSGFLNLDKLGFSAANNVDVVIRQTIFNGFYALLDLKTFEPFPDFWMMWTHHNLVGRGVFNVTWSVPGDDLDIRVYAQCCKEVLGYPKGSVVVFALNVNKNEQYQLSFGMKGKIDAYVLTPEDGSVLSKNVLLNNELLQLQGDVVPAFKKSTVEVDSIVVEPQTFGFYVFKDTVNDLCLNFQG